MCTLHVLLVLLLVQIIITDGIDFTQITLQTQVPIPKVVANAPLYYIVSVPGNASYTGLSVSILCPSACTSNTKLNIAKDPKIIADGQFTWQYVGVTSFPGVLINPFSNPPFDSGAYYISYTSDADLENIQILAQGYSDESETWKLGADEKVLVKSMQLASQETHDLTIFIPVAVPSTIQDVSNDKTFNNNSPTSSHRGELDALFKSYYSTTKLSVSDHLRYCNANRHEVYIAPAHEKRPDKNLDEIKKSFTAISRPAVESCSLLEKKVLPFGAIRVDEQELKRLSVQPNVDYIMYLMVFSRDEKPLLLAGPYHSVLIETKSVMKAAVITPTLVRVPTTVVLAGFCFMVLSSLLAVVGYITHVNIQEKQTPTA